MSAAQADVRTRVTPDQRVWFTLDAVVTGLNGLAYLMLAGALAGLLGPEESVLRWLGAGLLGFTVLVLAVSRGNLPPVFGWAVVVLNEIWVVASLFAAAAGSLGLDAVGRGWAVAQALVVGALALLQARSLRSTAR